MKLTRRSFMGKLPFGIAGLVAAVRSPWAILEAEPAKKREAEMYVALYTEGGAEVTGGGYARVEATDTETCFPPATAGWGGVIVAFALMDAATGGNCLYYRTDEFAISKAVFSGDTVCVAIDDVAAFRGAIRGIA